MRSISDYIQRFLVFCIMAMAIGALPASALTPPAVKLDAGGGVYMIVDSTKAVTFGPNCNTGPGTTCTPGTVIVSAVGELVLQGPVTVGPFTIGAGVVGEGKAFYAKQNATCTPAPSCTTGLDIEVQSLTTGAMGGTLTVSFTDTGYSVSGAMELATQTSYAAGTGTTTYTGYLDTTNTPFGTGTLVGTIPGVRTAASASFNVTGGTSVSLTAVSAITLGPNGTYSDDFSLHATPTTGVLVTCSATGTGEVGVPFNSGVPTVTGGAPPYTFSIIGTLPAGLTLNANGSVTGTPTAAGSFLLQVKDSTGLVGTPSCPFTIVPLPPTLTCSATITGGEVGVPFNAPALTVTGGTPPYTFSISSGTLPAGLTLNTSTGAVTGTPTALGFFFIQVKDANGLVGNGTCPYTIGAVPAACTNLPYPYGNPPALSSVVFNESGVLQAFAPSGTSGHQVSAWFSDEHAPLLGARAVQVITSSGTQTTDYSSRFTAYVPATMGVLSLNAPLPVGTTARTGSQAGTDTALQSSDYNYGVGYAFNGRPLWPALFVTDLTVNGINSMAGDWQQGGTSAFPPNDIYGVWKGAVVTVDETKSPAVMSVTTDADPAPNAMNNGNPPGIPDVPPGGFGQNLGYFTEAVWDINTLGLPPGHSYRLQVIVHDGDQNHSGGDVGEGCLAGFSLPIYPLTLMLPASGNAGFVGTPYNSSLAGAGGIAPLTYALTIGTLPPGLTLNASTGAISGIPTTAGPYTFMSQVKDSSGNTLSAQFTITIGPEQPLSLSCSTVNTGLVSSPFNAQAPTPFGGFAPYTFSVASGALPAGLTLNASTGAVTGTPTTVGSFSLKVGDTQGHSAGNCSYTVNACLLSDLGPAGSFSILGISGAGQNNPQINVQNSLGGGGAIGVGSGVQLHVSGNGVNVSNPVYEDSSATVKTDGGATITGTQTTESFTAIQTAALAASAAFAALTPTQTFSQPIQNATTITGNGGRNVIAINDQVNLNNNANLTIAGGLNDTFVINIAKDLQLQNGSSIILSGVTASQVVFNFIGNGNLQIQSNNNGISNSAGIFLDPQGQIVIQGGTHNSAFISGNQINIKQAQNGSLTISPITCVGPPVLSLSCPAGSGDVGANYNSSFVATFGAPPYSYSISSGSIGSLGLNTTNGALTGTLTTLPLNFTGKVTDAASATATAACTVNTPACLLPKLGTSTFSILGISGAGQGNPQINVQSPINGTATLGVGVNVQLQINGNTDLTNPVFEDPSARIQTGGGNTITGTQTKESFAGIQSAALAASAAFAALTPTQTFSQIQNTTTITGNGGQNVISVTNQINLNNGQNLVISGGPTDTFIFNIAQGQNFQLQNGSSVILNGVSPSQVAFNFLGNGSNVQFQNGSSSAGIFLNPGGQIDIQGGTHNSMFISGNQIQIQNSPTVNLIHCN